MNPSHKKIKALCYFHDDNGRDPELLIPLMYFAEKYLNVEIENAFIYDIDKIRRRKPDIIIIANTIGSEFHHHITKYAHKNGIKVFALTSEGNFRTDGTFNYWGHNNDKIFYQEYICLWSNRTKNFLLRKLPTYREKIVITGATGFDRYKVYDFESKDSFLKRHGLRKYKRVIGYAGWAFGKTYNPQGIIDIKQAFKEKAEDRIRWMREQQTIIESILRESIEKNPDILFILKRHPGEIPPHLTMPDNNEMVNLENYKNVLYLRNDEDIHTLINVSDIWTAFESTTVLETWIMKNSPTIFINPEVDFVRDSVYRGTVIVDSYEEFQKKINEFYEKGAVLDMNLPEKIKVRKEIIEEVIGYADGYNHLRAGYYLQKTINKINTNQISKVKINYSFYLRHILVSFGTLLFNKQVFLKLPKFKKTIWIFEKQKLNNINLLKKKYYSYLDKFYTKHNINQRIKSKEIWNDIINH